MGRRTSYVGMGLAGLAFVISLISICLPMHRLAFYISVVKAGQVTVYAVYGYADLSRSDFCSIGSELPRLCQDLNGKQDLHEIQQRFCVNVVNRMFPNACTGLSYAYGLGILLVIVVVINWCLHGTGCWITYYYMVHSPKKDYREFAFVIITIGTCLHALTLLLYLLLVGWNLDNVEVETSLKLVSLNTLSASEGTGISFGFWFMWLSVLVQIVEIVLIKTVKSSDEARLCEVRAQQEFEQEMAAAEGFDADRQWNQAGGYRASGGCDAYGQSHHTEAYSTAGGCGAQLQHAGWGMPLPYGSQPPPPTWGASTAQPMGYPQQPARQW